ncbi:unnamed protein product [Ilex paraguariensis]|uniref:Uncharacterized protein n=1 Tax=Ilex paraguariensis TaxID=185542 RepID=A0ABC8TIC6_9AQUA
MEALVLFTFIMRNGVYSMPFTPLGILASSWRHVTIFIVQFQFLRILRRDLSGVFFDFWGENLSWLRVLCLNSSPAVISCFLILSAIDLSGADLQLGSIEPCLSGQTS